MTNRNNAVVTKEEVNGKKIYVIRGADNISYSTFDKPKKVKLLLLCDEAELLSTLLEREAIRLGHELRTLPVKDGLVYLDKSIEAREMQMLYEVVTHALYPKDDEPLPNFIQDN